MVGSGFLKKPVIPAVCAGLVASVAFYVFYGLHIPRVFALIVFAFCVAAAFLQKTSGFNACLFGRQLA